MQPTKLFTAQKQKAETMSLKDGVKLAGSYPQAEQKASPGLSPSLYSSFSSNTL